MPYLNNQTIAVLHFGGNTLRGTEICAIYSIDGFHEAGYRIVLVANNSNIITSRLKSLPYKVIQSDFPEIMFDGKLSCPLLRWFRELIRLKANLKQENIDLILTSGGLPCQLGLPLSKLLGIPIVAHLHHPAPKRYLYFWGVPWVTKIIVPSQHTKNIVEEKTKAVAKIVYNGIDTDHAFVPAARNNELRQSLGINKNDIVITSVGALVPHKRFDLFLRAFALAKKQSQQQLRALIIGAGPERTKLKNLADDLHITKAVTFIEQVPEIPLYFQQASDIHLLASSEEGFGLSVVEAAACELPNIVSASTALTEVVRNGVDGIHVESAEPEAFAKAILELSENRDLRLHMGKAGRDKANKNFSLPAYKSTLLQQLQLLLPAKSKCIPPDREPV